MSYFLSDQQASNFNPEMYANEIFNSTSRPIRRPMYLPGPMAKGNFIGGLQMLGDAFGGLKDTLSNRKLKKRLFEESLPEYYKYTVEKDPNDPNDYVLDTKDLYDAMMGEGTLRTPDAYERDLQKYSMVNFDPESGQYNTMYSSRPIDQSLYPGYSDIFGEGSKSLGQIREDIMGNQELMDLITQAEGAPEGWFPYMEPDGRMGVTEDPEYMQYYYNTMMGNYEMGGSLPEAQVGMSLFDPNALDAGIGVTGGGAGLRSNSNASNITAETLATDVTREGSIFSKAAENLRDFFKTLRIPRYYSAYEYGGSLPRAQVMGEFGEMYLDPNKSLSQQTNAPTKEEIERANLATAGAQQYAREEEEKDYQSIVASDPDKYNIKVIQYPYGYEGMEPGHIEAALVDDKGNYISADDEAYADILRGRDPFINRWDNVGNRRVTYRGDDPDVRTATMELSREELENFLDQASTFLPTDNKLFGLPTAFGFQTTDGAYDFITSNCADGVCLGLGDPDGPDMYDYERTQNLTNPLNVMDLVIQDPRTVSSSGNRVTLLEGVSDLMNREMGGLVEYQNFGQVNRPTFREWFIQNQVRASAMTQEEAEQAYDFETLDPVDYMAKYDPVEVTEPDITIPDDVTIANPTVTGEKAKFQRFLDSPGMDLFKGIGTFGVQSATALNEMFGLDKVAREAEEDRMRMTSADNAFMTSNPLFDQGIYDVNTGLTPGGYAKGFGMARLGMEVDADPEIIEALVKAGANVNYI